MWGGELFLFMPEGKKNLFCFPKKKMTAGKLEKKKFCCETKTKVPLQIQWSAPKR